MACGDSITAGFAMKTPGLVDSFYEYRGTTAFAGVDEGEVTVPNFLEQVSGKKVIGGSIKTGFPWEAIQWRGKAIREHNPPIDHLNAAQSNAKINLISTQIDYLVSQMKAEHVHMEEDWKLLTIFIGANNLCRSCKGHPEDQPQAFVDVMEANIEKIYKLIPRVRVNIVSLFNISGVHTASEESAYCKVVHDIVAECACMSKHGDEGRLIMDQNAMKINELLVDVERRWQAKDTPGFGLALQPFTWQMVVPDLSFLSSLDCFHPSVSANVHFATYLWNSMLTPPAKKPKSCIPPVQPICPSLNDYLQ
eukprot:CAMPEP_0117420510 /NCGR_PEP_ID=MMETSP0758-20121206/1830_1 /TAXON_ID=63605 /ORGANISM="Percolomonas cosmopolitus, Strain AE-1 (ATCC 50343)" /LENGTH=306 /DNA_ID=CAMNT_0005202163 /DNA_START=174 /DNA_END=1094 /DNA_ORIENTATION=+